MVMVNVKIRVPEEMEPYVSAAGEREELVRNAMLLYPHVKNLTISHGRAAEILGIHKYELIELYDSLGLPYLDQDIQEVEGEVRYWKTLKGVTV